MADLVKETARQVVEWLKSGEISIENTLDALQQRIAEVDGKVNALPTLCMERAREAAHCIDRESILAGMPVAIKDLDDVAGVRTTYGSMLSEHHVPQTSGLLVQRIEANGGVIYAKSNTPEFGSGGNTFNDVFGATHNPRDLTRSAGGSSGGAAAALASGTAWLAQGSDTGGSLRTPASFCGVTSLRPSPGLVISNPGHQPFQVYSQAGPMARDLLDLALFTDAMTGPSSLVGLSKTPAASAFRDAAAAPIAPAKIACSIDLGIADTSVEVEAVFSQALEKLERAQLSMQPGHPDLTMFATACYAPRALDYALSFGEQLEQTRSIIKPENVWNIEAGLNLGNREILDSMAAQGQIFQNASRFMQDFDLLICPASILTAYPVEERYPGFSDGLEYSEYLQWLSLPYAITATTLPVITLPCGKTPQGLPVGMQLIGKPHGEVELFRYARHFEQILGWDPTPVDPAVSE